MMSALHSKPWKGKTMRTYQALVQVHGADGYIYWNTLSTPKPTHAEAQSDVESYLLSKVTGSNGFRKGPPGRTMISERDVQAEVSKIMSEG